MLHFQFRVKGLIGSFVQAEIRPYSHLLNMECMELEREEATEEYLARQIAYLTQSYEEMNQYLNLLEANEARQKEERAELIVLEDANCVRYKKLFGESQEIKPADFALEEYEMDDNTPRSVVNIPRFSSDSALNESNSKMVIEHKEVEPNWKEEEYCAYISRFDHDSNKDSPGKVWNCFLNVEIPLIKGL